MEISELLSDDAVLVEIGARLARRRLDLQLTQAEVAEQAGLAKRTVERIEAGASVHLSGLIRVFRVLGLLTDLERVFPQSAPRPMDLLKQKGKVRQRASSRRAGQGADEPWSWDEQK